jgi:hypothetical protein
MYRKANTNDIEEAAQAWLADDTIKRQLKTSYRPLILGAARAHELDHCFLYYVRAVSSGRRPSTYRKSGEVGSSLLRHTWIGAGPPDVQRRDKTYVPNSSMIPLIIREEIKAAGRQLPGSDNKSIYQRSLRRLVGNSASGVQACNKHHNLKRLVAMRICMVR